MEDQQNLQEQAARCRRLAAGQSDRVLIDRLLELADEYDERARAVPDQSDSPT